jgi:nucleotide-binding universal stress UspA family protein
VQVRTAHPLLERLGVKGNHGWGAEPVLSDADVIRLAHREGLRPSTFETDSLQGHPRQVLLEEAQRWQADLIVVGIDEQEPSGVRLGTVAEHLIRYATCPVLIVNGDGAMPPRKVLFPVDLSEFAWYAMACGLNFLDQIQFECLPGRGCEALLVMPPARYSGGVSREDLERTSRDRLSTWIAGDPDLAGLVQSVEAGTPAQVIVDHAKTTGTDLIVMGTHGHGSHGQRLQGIGSVAGEVLGEAPCHMLIVPPSAEFGAEIAEAVASQTEPRFDKRLFL